MLFSALLFRQETALQNFLFWGMIGKTVFNEVCYVLVSFDFGGAHRR